MDLATLQAWQKDYSNFVVERLQPMWADAMKAGAAATEARFPGFYFDTLDFGTRNWTTVHGAEWVTSVTDQQRDAIARALPGARVVKNALCLDRDDVEQTAVREVNKWLSALGMTNAKKRK